ncbi:MAG: MBL fold metallo-hydrolase [Acidobacteriota bacterium]
MEIYPGVFELKSTFGNRYVQQYFFLGDIGVLLDAGVAGTPNSVIFPYLEKLGVSPNSITLAIALHADVDHHGGLPAIKDASPTTLLACHQLDLRLIEDPETLYQHRYNYLARDHALGFDRQGMVDCPEGRKIDLALSGGETIQLAKNWPLRIWHVPGHSQGHLAVYDEKNGAVFTSDAVQAAGYPTVEGKLAFGPTYYAVDAYLATIRFLEGRSIHSLYSGHWPPLHGPAVQAFLESSRRFVERADELLIGYLKAHSRGVTLKEVISDLGPQLGEWPAEATSFLQFALYGHLSRLEESNLVQRVKCQPVQWRLL